ncbi:MAG: hypothetical protein BGO52_11950 [Sphingobacteriales bacterium 44-61]|nr:MAG: hypothetical protein BGO52_11950 [Sphingobacteriales bacterium 44-61]
MKEQDKPLYFGLIQMDKSRSIQKSVIQLPAASTYKMLGLFPLVIMPSVLLPFIFPQEKKPGFIQHFYKVKFLYYV